MDRYRRPKGERRYPPWRGNIAVNPVKICIARGSSVLAGRHAAGMCGRGRLTPTQLAADYTSTPRVITGLETGPEGYNRAR